MKNMLALMLSALIIFFAAGCDENSTDPNSIGGDTDIALTEPGSEFGVYLSMEGDETGALSNIDDSCFISENKNGIVTMKCRFTTDEETLKEIDTLLGTQSVPEDIKHQVVDELLARFGAVLDTSDKQNIRLDVTLKGKVTSEGIQDFMYSGGDESKPFTLVKYNAKVGDKYEFTDSDGAKITRNVVYKSTDDEFELGFILIKVIKIEEKQNDPLINKITYIANHKFGLVGVQLDMKNGKSVLGKVFPWHVLP